MYLGGLLCLAGLLCSSHLGILGLLSDGVARHLDVVGSLHTRNSNSTFSREASERRQQKDYVKENTNKTKEKRSGLVIRVTEACWK